MLGLSRSFRERERENLGVWFLLSSATAVTRRCAAWWENRLARSRLEILLGFWSMFWGRGWFPKLATWPICGTQQVEEQKWGGPWSLVLRAFPPPLPSQDYSWCFQREREGSVNAIFFGVRNTSCATMEGKGWERWGTVGVAMKGQHLWGGAQGHSGPDPAHHLPLFLGTAHFSKVSGIRAVGFAFLWRTTTALRRGLVSLWPINIKAEKVSMKHSSPNQRSFILHLFLYVVSESLILRKGCGYALFVFFLFPFLSFRALYFKLISWQRVRMLSSGMPAVTFRSGGNPEFIFEMQLQAWFIVISVTARQAKES